MRSSLAFIGFICWPLSSSDGNGIELNEKNLMRVLQIRSRCAKIKLSPKEGKD